MNFEHRPVLLEECIENLCIKSNGIYVDGTLGGAGHSSRILQKLGRGGHLVGIDRDISAIEASGERLASIKTEARYTLVNDNFGNMARICSDLGIHQVDGILLDLGVSSHQLDEVERGFSYQHDAPLDMRMDTSQELTAETVVNDYDLDEIRRIISEYGEERWAGRIAEFIGKARMEKRITRTSELVDIIKAAIPAPARRQGPHPAKRTFQAIRIAVNNELGILENTLEDAVSLLAPGGRLCVITFHSLEDRIVKHKFREFSDPCICPDDFPVCMCGKQKKAVIVTRKPIIPGDKELKENPRARSAKQRVIEKI